MTQETGLRERKKLAARAAMSQTALRLAIDRGLGAVTAEAVAEAVGVSPRTFRNYFSAPEEAVVAGFDLRADGVIEDIATRPPGEPLWDSLLAVLPVELDDLLGGQDNAKQLFRLFHDSPVLLAHQLACMEQVERRMASMVAARTGTDPDRDVAPHLVAAAAMVAIRVSLTLWVEGHPGSSLTELLRQSLAELRAGLPAAARTVPDG